MKDAITIERDWLENLDRELAAHLVELALIAQHLAPQGWQPWQLNRANVKFALDRIAAARTRLVTAMAPFDLK